MANILDSKTKREKLPPRREPYWHVFRKGAALGYRKLENGNGTWVARWRDDEKKQRYKALGEFPEYDIAETVARQWVDSCTKGISTTPTTVQGACEAYVAALEAEGRKTTAKDAKGRFTQLVYEKDFGKIQLDKLRSSAIEKWRNDQLATGKDDDEEDLRRSKDTANRKLSALKAALNRAFRQHLVASDAAWKVVKPFKKVGKGRSKQSFLTIQQRKALIDACPDDLALLVKALLLLGCRPGEVANMNASSYNKRSGTITLNGKTGERTVAVSTAAAQFLAEQQKNKLPTAPMLATSCGQRWKKDAWKKVFKIAAKAAGLPDEIVLYSMRHTAISEMIQAGMDSFLVAQLTGTSVVMIEKHYGHLRHEVVRQKLDEVNMI